MKDCYYHIVDDNEVILSNLPHELLPEVDSCPAATQCIPCPIKGVIKRQKKLATDNNGFVYFCSYDQDMNKKTFAYYYDALYSLYKSFNSKIKQIDSEKRLSAKTDINRLQHNVNSYNARIQDDLESVFSIQDTKMSEWPKVVQNITKIVENNPKKAALVLLKTRKNISLVNAEMNVYDFLENPNGEIQFNEHQLHKVIMLSLQPFFLDFVENRITPKLGECRETVRIDYSSVSVIFGHLWSNAVKYTCGGTDIEISFSVDEEYVNVIVESQSMVIESDEVDKIMLEGYSGRWSQKSGKSGNGIGMHYIRYLMGLNLGKFLVIPGTSATFISHIPYTTNKFVLSFKKK